MSKALGERFQALRARLDDSLFPTSPQSESGATRGEQLTILLALFALATVLQLLRPGLTASLNSLWAEDGPIFLQAAATEGFLDALFSPYAGYLVLVPRLIGEVAAAVPLEAAAAATSIASAAVAALCGLVVWRASAAHIRNPWLRGSLACLTVLAPVAGLESVDSAAYVPWYMLYASFWVLLWRPATALGAALAALFLLATGLSTPGVWFFLPVAALRAVAIRDGRDLAIVGSFFSGALAQIPVLALNQEEAVDPAWTSDIWAAYAQRVVDGAAFGQRLGGWAWAHFGWPFLAALLIAAAVALAVAFRRSGPRGRLLAAIAIPTSLALFVVSAYQRAVGSEILWPHGNYHGSAGRYAIVPALLLVGAAFALIDDSSRRWRGPARLPWVGAGAVALAVVAIATSFSVREPIVRGTPPWDDALRAAAAVCANEDIVDAPIETSPPGFGMSLPCEELESVPLTAARPQPSARIAARGHPR